MKKITTKSVVNAYRRYAPAYDLIFGTVLEQGRKELGRAVHLESPRTLLEVGVGTGLTFRHYPATTKITGVDVSSEMLKKAYYRAQQLIDYDICLQCMDGEKLKYENSQFDCVVLPYVLSVTQNPKLLISESRRVCKKGGLIAIANHFSGIGPWSPLEKIFSGIGDLIGFRTEFSFSEQIEKYDWKIEEIRKVNLLSLSKLVLIRN